MTKRQCAIALTAVLGLSGCTDSTPSGLGSISAAVGGNRQVVVSPNTASLTPGATQQFTAQLLQNDVPKKASFVWSSSNNAVATVSSTGLVSARADGQAIITATTSAPTTSGTATVTVRTPPPAPVARFVSACTHLSCAFNADSSSALPGAIFVWTFGDSTSADSGRTATHSYGAAGNYPVRLTVTDSGGSDDTVRVVTVTAPPPSPVARFAYTCSYLTCTFNADSSSALPGASFAWTFGDSTPADSGRTATHNYAAAGSYAVRLVVTDSGGSDDTVRVLTVMAAPPAPVARYTYSCADLSCSFDASASQAGAGATFSWNFGDGTAAVAGTTPAHTYATAGSYDVQLTVTDSGGVDDTTQTVTVTAPIPPPTIVATIPLSRRPFGSVVAPSGTAWIGQLDTGTVQRLDVPSAQFTGAAELGSLLNGPAVVAANAAGTRVYAATISGLVGSINAQTLAIEHTVHVPINFNNTANITATPAGDTVFVGMTSGEIYKIDLQNEMFLANRTFPVGASYHFAWNSDRSRLYASARDDDGTPGKVYELDPVTLIASRVFVTNARPQGIAFSGDDTRLYIANEQGGVLVWNVAANTVADTIATGCRGGGLLRRPDTGWLYVTCPLDGRVVVVDPSSGVTIANIAMGGRPREPSFDPATGSVIVPNESGWVDIIR